VKFARIITLIAISCLSGAGQESEQSGPKQPIPFNHHLHVTTLKQPCKSCHADLDPGELVDIPDTAQCMQCHSAIEPKTQAEKKLVAFAKQNRNIDWVRVYRIPTFVQFDHRQHAQAGVECDACHGPVRERTALWQEKDLSMGSCMNCHRVMRASLDCSSCHEPR
jgi:hypothetical protein